MRVVEHARRAEDDREADRHQRVERAELQAVDEELEEEHLVLLVITGPARSGESR